jgi:PEP-CTERM motif
MILLKTSRLISIAALMLGAAVPVPASAAPLFEATAGSDSRSGSAPTSAGDGQTFVDGALTRSYSASARADRGSVGARADSDASILGNQSCAGCTIGTTAFARATFDDLIFSGADDVTTSINLHIAGALVTGGRLGGPFEQFDSRASATFTATIAEPSGFGPLILGGSSSGLEARSVEDNDPVMVFRQSRRLGDLGSATFNSDSIVVNELVTGAPFTVPVDEPLILTLEMRASSSALVDARFSDVAHNVSSSGHGNFFDTFSLPTSGPVFNLPQGYTVNSVSGLIVDNRWVGAPTSAVPEPGSLTLLALGIAGLGGIGWRRRRNV